MNKVVLCWSGGKDSALALQYLLEDNSIEVVGLLTTVNQEFNRVSMHGVRRELIEQQARQIGLPLYCVEVNEATNEHYEAKMAEQHLELKKMGVTHIAFGDIFLEDLKAYREEKCAKIGLKCLFPLWKKDTHQLLLEFWDRSFETIICCTNSQMGSERVGVIYTPEVLNNLPQGVDPCGENGEFHTYLTKAPYFTKSLMIKVGEKITKEYTWTDDSGNEQKSIFYFADIASI